MAPTKKAGSGAAFWIIIIFLGLLIGAGLWFWLKREEKPAQTTPSSSLSQPCTSVLSDTLSQQCSGRS
jgi:hypothetical protein